MSSYKKPSITVDTLIFNKFPDENKKFILIKRKNSPFKNHWALPGGFVEYGETVEYAAIRESKEETGIDIELKRLFNIYSKPDRDPRGHTITIVYLATGNINDMNAGSDAENIRLCSFEELSSLKIAFDHEKILTDILENITK
ncbi:MAG: NUDIX hydrolase [Methanobrevibacter sp.]|nr:NUDIX hydrolase [Methanobrevibacter sp.]